LKQNTIMFKKLRESMHTKISEWLNLKQLKANFLLFLRLEGV